MSTTKDVVFVLVPGSFATSTMYDKVTPILEKAGYIVKPIELLSANDGSRLPAPQMTDDAAHIRSDILSILDSGKNVVLALQSYAGFPGSEAVKGLSLKDRGPNATAVLGIVYAASFLPEEGKSLRDTMDAYIPEFYKAGIPGGYLPPLAHEMVCATFNDVTDQEEILRYGRSMTGHSSDSYSGRVTYSAWKDIPGTTIIPQQDLIVPTVEQEKQFENAIKEGGKIKRVAVEGGGHGITVTQPQLVADELIALAVA
jgi:pimeloyl-ACP methyl ester carboxylesterase